MSHVSIGHHRVACSLWLAAIGVLLLSLWTPASAAQVAPVFTTAAIADAQVTTAAPQRNDGASEKMTVCHNCEQDGAEEKRAYLRFDGGVLTQPVAWAAVEVFVATSAAAVDTSQGSGPGVVRVDDHLGERTTGRGHGGKVGARE